MTTEWRIEKIVPGGSGFLRLSDGRTAFAGGALPGELVEVTDVEDHRSYVVARALRVVEPSPDRVAPACPVAARCGGCDFMHVAYSAQLREKCAILREALERTGGFRSLPPIDMVASKSEFRYRGRLRLHVDADGRIGLFARQSQHLIEIPGCLVSNEAIDVALGKLRAIASERGRELGACEAVEVRLAPKGAPLTLRLIPRSSSERLSKGLLTALRAQFDVAVAGMASDIEQIWPLPGAVELSAPPEAFTQVNWAINQILVQSVVDGALAREARRFCDLYAGAGNFTLALLAAGLSGTAVESGRAALSAARRAAERQALSGGRFVHGDVEAALGALRSEPRFDLVVLDPPRAGAREILPLLIELRPLSIAYSACDPVTLARDLRVLAQRGYALEAVRGFDMFPQTHHFETLAWLSAPAG